MRVTDNRVEAESLALEALSFLARDAARIESFLAKSGIGPNQLRDVAGEPGFLLAVLDHLLADEPLLLMFSENAEIDPDRIPAARELLGGGNGRY
jgi:hypothetical protein